MTPTKRALLVILDGWGLGPDPKVDALAQADTPCFDGLMESEANAELVTYGEEVGLPEGQMGNSEVGHLNIGAGRVVYQELARINKAIKDNTLASEPALRAAFTETTGTTATLHLMGLLSDGGVHSHIDHLLALCDAATNAGVERIRIHAFLDGRDTDPHGGAKYIKRVADHIKNQPAEIASLTGRYYAMDRDNRWERIQVGYDALVNGKGEETTELIELLKKRYKAGQTDEFVHPIIHTDEDGKPFGNISDGDAVIFFNFRTDRPRQITEALTQRPLKGTSDGVAFDMKPKQLHFVTMTRYDEAFKGLHVVYSKDDLPATLGEVLAKAGKTQLRIAETEKYPHVTFFFNGGREEAFKGESRIIVPSPKVATYDLQPEMSAAELLGKLTAHMKAVQPDFVCVNFANTDMVGHTGIMSAAIKAAETVDGCLEELLAVAKTEGYDTIIIADHGNSDVMSNPDGSPNTAHTTNPVPVIYVPGSPTGKQVKNGKLGDVAPTILEIVGVAQPSEMDGKSLFV
ncbi:MAG: 2,3-bisphosphoglycerate-independent phosphoglycerate mutase [Saprospiraceae bacterium]